MTVHPTAVVEDGADIGDAYIGPFCFVGSQAKLHNGVKLNSHVIVEGETEIGENTLVHPFAVLGGAPQHLQYNGEQTSLVIGSNNIIREHVTINCGTQSGGGVTRVGSNTFIMTGSHIAHDCHVGDHVIFANNATLGGHVKVGDYAFLGGLCAIHQFTRIGDYAFIGGCAAVAADVIPFASAMGNHATLVGLNVVGLKRRNFSRHAISELRSMYKLLFSSNHTFKERLEIVRSAFSSDEVMKVIKFIDETQARAVMAPDRTLKTP
ncbi:acyl-ACP--UDP-N-acetylglucosamine O-acyltransferase [Hyphococcus flavus]|uniref:Acyl-[acyl-carrier-protein]--UDP-N-acetylglucosamine O-acyltransferase n=1 Tax=Hyphococcus flavus TaxID=1866326 RepID=A0AAE9ZDN7_9PROT|nr:acyl-ACP--UDP-N-acetylglucosamine O-acyltransferase [Hyphococcus flavus]WDI31042.1 acyl-ACP--UDP-N-acetylglucosamine O-acyltransferase [Hyphococcus flavus]